MTTIPTRPTHETETQRALTLVSNAVSDVLLGHLGTDTSPTPRPIPIAFLDDGRRVFLVIDSPTGSSAQHDRPRSWGVEITRDSDLTDGSAGVRTAVRTTAQLTESAALDATRYLLSATA